MIRFKCEAATSTTFLLLSLDVEEKTASRSLSVFVNMVKHLFLFLLEKGILE